SNTASMLYLFDYLDLFDKKIVAFLNGYAQHSWTFDSLMIFLSADNFFKGGLFMVILWWFWFRRDQNSIETRQSIVCAMVGCLVSLASSRFIAALIGDRPRPVNNPAYHFLSPLGLDSHSVLGWSSFPSNHAAWFFTLAICLLYL